ncbi:FkbM family methyltransferase [Halobaculum rubrum]|uniref:FkbM family methyltransferase n=1 Tax=Halobaculum rubrum TaxID=2872158 RepID=UPI001CA39A40|nr:FkbM family methyltransferase [Halobaculum rubrum]QZX99904.1 FkbM family methyltransferase [Halobaculum rubrum]
MFAKERPQLARTVETLRADDVFFDIGANLGLYTAFAANCVTEGTVVAFEPYPPNVEVLRSNAALNADNVEIEAVAASETRGTTSFSQPEERVGSQIGGISPDGSNGLQVETVDVDSLVASGEVPVPNIVKIDVEGAEPLVLAGMAETLDRDAVRTVFCEVHQPTSGERDSARDYGSSLADIRGRFESRGFVVERIDSESIDEVHLVATRE